MLTKQLRELERQAESIELSKFTAKMKTILEDEFNYELNPVAYQAFGTVIWFPKNEPMDLTLMSKTITMEELVPIRTEAQLRKLIKSKLKK
jgi:hypothetical protein